MEATTIHSSASWFGNGGTGVATQTEPEQSVKKAEQTLTRNSASASQRKVPSVRYLGAPIPPFKVPPIPFEEYQRIVKPFVLKRPLPKPPSKSTTSVQAQ